MPSRSVLDRRFAKARAGALAIAVVAGCQRPAPHVTVAVSAPTSSVAEISPSSDGPVGLFATAERPVRLWGGVNETLDFQVSVRTGFDAADAVGLRCTPLISSSSRIEPTDIQIFRLHSVAIERWPGWHIRSVARQDRVAEVRDCLVPLNAPQGGLPQRLSPNTSYDFWVDVRVPKGAFEGKYAGSLELLSGGWRIAHVPIELTVRPFVLPDGDEIPMIAALDHQALFRHHLIRDGRGLELPRADWRGDPRREEIDALLGDALRLLRDHRLSPVLPRLAPSLRVTAQQGVVIDWEAFDAVASPCLNGRIFADRSPVPLWPVPIPDAFGDYRDVSSAAAVSVRRRYLAGCADHFRDRGWLDRAFLPPIPGSDARGRRAASRSAVSGAVGARAVTEALDPVQQRRAADFLEHDVPPDLRPVVPWCPQDMRPFGLRGHVVATPSRNVIWAPPAQFFDRAEMARRTAAGDIAWWVPDRPPFTGTTSIYGSSTDARILSWQAGREGASAILLDEVNTWPAADAASTPSDRAAWDANVLLYSGRPFGLSSPVPSVRLKRLRRSQQDAAYCQLLTEKGCDHVRDALAQSLAPYAGTGAIRSHFADGAPSAWPDRDAWFELAREIMAEELVSGGGAAEGADAAFTRTAAWRRFMLELRSPRMWVDGCRARERTGESEVETVAFDCFVTVQDVSRVPIRGRFDVVGEETGRVTSEESVELGELQPNASRTIAYPIRVQGPFTANGVLDFPLAMHLSDGGSLTATARAAYASAQFDRVAPKIDGELHDWTAIPGATASEFRAIPFGAKGGRSAEDAASRAVPAMQTSAFFRRDARFLYVGISARWERPAELPSTGNALEYDDLVPVGEELVEILLDPLNGRTRSPSDLFHLAVKPSGAVVTETGIRTDPPCGERRSWDADVLTATRLFRDRWTAELRIPLTSFGPEAMDTPIWGLNVTRFDRTNQELSTWSGAVGNAYDPISLGNLYLAPAEGDER